MIEEDLEKLNRNEAVRFNELLKVCIRWFGEPRIRGSHHVFKVPWVGDPRINLQKDGKDAKRYQVKQVVEALEKLAEENNDGF